jgi:tRNA(adenine34) deaminase
MQLTLELAKEALNKCELPIAAIIFLGDKVISKNYTTEKADKRFLIHAELKALIEADSMRFSFQERKKMQLFTTLEPCMMCLGAAMSSFIGEIYYALESPSDGAVNIAKAWNPESENFPGFRLPKIFGGILREQSQELFLEYTKKSEPGPMYDWAKSLTLL